MANSVDPDQTAPIGGVRPGSTLFASMLNSSVMLGNYLQQTTFSDAFFSWHFLRVKVKRYEVMPIDFSMCMLFALAYPLFFLVWVIR